MTSLHAHWTAGYVASEAFTSSYISFFYGKSCEVDMCSVLIWFQFSTMLQLSLGPTQVKCRLLISSIFDAMNFQLFWKCSKSWPKTSVLPVEPFYWISSRIYFYWTSSSRKIASTSHLVEFYWRSIRAAEDLAIYVTAFPKISLHQKC